MRNVTVAIPSFKRPKSLEKLLIALEQLETATHVEVLVADNDCDGREDFATCARLRERGYRWPLHAVIVPERGIPQARNALAEEALKLRGEFIAMLDDDEWPEARWLDEFLRVQTETGADALHGAVLRAFDERPSAWAETCEGVSAMHAPTGPIAMIESTSNVIIHRSCFENMPKPWFDPGFALTGGEDRDFFTRLKAKGAKFAWADGAVVYAHVPASRASLGWALQRAYRVGNSDLRVFLKYRPHAADMAREIAKIAGALLLFPFALAILAFVPNRRALALCKLARAAGKIAALFGRYYNEYATTHGG